MSVTSPALIQSPVFSILCLDSVQHKYKATVFLVEFLICFSICKDFHYSTEQNWTLLFADTTVFEKGTIISSIAKSVYSTLGTLFCMYLCLQISLYHLL